MRVFILGGTGSIGTAVLAELRARAHAVTALSRSAASDEKIRALGATPQRGDLRDPGAWAEAAIGHDAIIHTAATFTEDMGEVDTGVVSTLIRRARDAGGTRRMLYTGGCWLYGETGDAVATEARPFDPLPAFAWMVENAGILLQAAHLSTAVIHPAMVYHRGGGVFARFLAAARAGRPAEIWGSPDTRWPLIHRDDLARAYCDLLERPELTGYFNAAAEPGVRVGEIAQAISRAFDSPDAATVVPLEALVAQHGAWAKGPTLDQQMSAARLRAEAGWAPEIADYRASDLFDI